MPYRDVAVGKQRELLLGEDLVDQTHVLVVGDAPVGDIDGYARALLPSVLEGEQPVVDLSRERTLLLGDHPEYAALLMHAALVALCAFDHNSSRDHAFAEVILCIISL